MGFGGPAILSNAGSPIGRAGGGPMAFRVYGSILGRYDTNLGISETADANTALRNLTGGQAGWGVFGVHQGQEYLVGLDYHGSYRRYSKGGSRNGDNHFATLNFVYQLSPRTEIFISPGAASYSFAQAGVPSSLLGNSLTRFNDPLNDPFDTRSNAVHASGGVAHMLADRTQISFHGSGFYVRRDNPALVDSQGAVGGVSYRHMLGPNKAIGATYNYLFFFFPGGFGESKLHLATIDYSHQLSEVWNLQLSAGGFRSENERLTQVALDPLLAAITGQSTLLQAFRGVSYQPLIQATIARQFQRGSLSFFYNRTIHPGNAFLTTAVNERGGTQYSYTATERLNFGFTVNAQRSSALVQNVGRYTSIGGGVGINYRLWRFIHLTARTDIRRWKIRGAPLDQDRVSVMAGLTFSPGDRPLSLF